MPFFRYACFFTSIFFRISVFWRYSFFGNQCFQKSLFLERWVVFEKFPCTIPGLWKWRWLILGDSGGYSLPMRVWVASSVVIKLRLKGRHREGLRGSSTAAGSRLSDSLFLGGPGGFSSIPFRINHSQQKFPIGTSQRFA